MTFRGCLLVTWLAGSVIGWIFGIFAATLFRRRPTRMRQCHKKIVSNCLSCLCLYLFIYFFFFMYIIWTLFTKKKKKRIPLKNVAKTTCQPPYCCLILNLRIDQENCIEEIQMTNEGGYIICSKALIWTQISFRRSKNNFKTTLKKAQRVIKTWQMTLIVNIYTLQLSL